MCGLLFLISSALFLLPVGRMWFMESILLYVVVCTSSPPIVYYVREKERFFSSKCFNKKILTKKEYYFIVSRDRHAVLYWPSSKTVENVETPQLCLERDVGFINDVLDHSLELGVHQTSRIK